MPTLACPQPQDVPGVSDSDEHIKWLNARKVRSFYTVITAEDLCSGARSLMQVRASGPGWKEQDGDLCLAAVCVLFPTSP